MKHLKTLFLSALIIIIAAACKKDKDDNNTDELAGTWELRKTSAAMIPNFTSYPEGNGNRIRFTNTTYEIYKDGQLKKSGQYTVTPDETVQTSVCLNLSPDEFNRIIVYNDSTSASKVFFKIANNKLTFIAGCYALDAGHSEEYERIPDDSNN